MRALSATLLLCTLAGCMTFPEYEVRPVELPAEFDWLHPGSTDENAVCDHLGAPAQRHEDGRIQTWGLTPELARAEPSTDGWAPAYSLVLVFGPDRRVQRASLVKLW